MRNVLFVKEAELRHRLGAIGFAALMSLIAVGLWRLLILMLERLSWFEPSSRELVAAAGVLIPTFLTFFVLKSFKWRQAPVIIAGIVLLFVSAHFYETAIEPSPTFTIPFIAGVLLLVRMYSHPNWWKVPQKTRRNRRP